MARRDEPSAPEPDTEGRDLWRRVTATVRPLRRRPLPVPSPQPVPAAPAIVALERKVKGRVPAPLPPPPRPAAPPAPPGSAPVDKGWERRLRSGRTVPDMVIDLHGHNLASAHSSLSRALDEAQQRGARLILLIAGKRRGPDEAPRGAIRRELAHWLAHSRHADRILAVRNAHPRHGGDGALYLLLRKG